LDLAHRRKYLSKHNLCSLTSREKKKGGAPAFLIFQRFIKQRRAHVASSGGMRRIRRIRRAA
jgi:hypothetical protein